MQDKYYGFDPVTADRIAANQHFLDTISDDEVVALLPEYLEAVELQNSFEIQISKMEIEKRRLNRQHEEKLRKRGIMGFIAGTAFAVALACATPQVKGADVLGNEVYAVMQDNGYGWRDDSQAGLIFNHYDSYVDYSTAINAIRAKCEEIGMTQAQIDVGLDAVLKVKPINSTFEDRVDARSDAYFQSKMMSEGKSK